jgi:hypothetical protein
MPRVASCVARGGANERVGVPNTRAGRRSRASFPLPQPWFDAEEVRSATVDRRNGRVTDLDVLPDAGLLVALVDGRCLVVDAATLEVVPAPAIADDSYVALAVNDVAAPELYKLCLATKRTFALFAVESRGRVVRSLARDSRALVSPEPPLALTYWGDEICVGFKREYSIIKEMSGKVLEVKVSLAGTMPAVRLLPGEASLEADADADAGAASGASRARGAMGSEEFLLSVAEETGVAFQLDGRPAMRSTMRWTPPRFLAYAFPYIIAVAPAARSLEVFSTPAMEAVQKLDVDAKVLGVCDGWTPRRALARGSNQVLLVLPDRVQRLVGVRFDDQAEMLLRKMPPADRFAGHLLRHTVPEGARAAVMTRFHINAARVLWLSLLFEPATPHLLKSHMDPRELLTMYTELHPDRAAASSATLAALADFRPTFFSAALTHGIVSGSKVCGGRRGRALGRHGPVARRLAIARTPSAPLLICHAHADTC